MELGFIGLGDIDITEKFSIFSLLISNHDNFAINIMSFIFIAAAIYEIVNNLIALTVGETSKKKYINFIKPLSIVNFTLLTATFFYIQSLLGSSKNDYAIYLLAAAFIFAIILSFFNLISKRTKAEKLLLIMCLFRG